MSQAQQSFNFCPHCGKPINQQQNPGQKLFCRYCGKDVGTVSVVGASVSAGTVVTQGQVIDRSQDAIKAGKAERCRKCNQIVETRGAGDARTFVPHYDPAKGKKICVASGRRITD